MMFIPWHFSTLSAWPIGFVADAHLVLYPYFAELVLLALFLNKFPNFSHIFCDRENMTLGTYILINPNSDQHQFSLNDVHFCLERDKIMRMNKMLTWEKYFDLLSNSLNTFFKEMYKDQFGEFVFV